MNGVRGHCHERINFKKKAGVQKKASNLPFERLVSFLSLMIIYPFFTLFISTLFLSTVITIIANQWTLIWLFLELNIISFIPIIRATRWNQEQEACLKYLLFQALGSSLLLLSTISTSLFFLITVALIIKLGIAPFHAWFPSVMKRISWIPSTLLITWQKIAPMSLIIFSIRGPQFYTVIGVLGALVGGVGGINQTHLRPLLAYSSIGHIGWIAARITASQFTSAFYLLTYIVITAAIIVSATITNTFLIKSSKKPFHAFIYFILALLLLSLSGIPPLAGFVPKIIVILRLKSIIVLMALIIGSLINLYYYLNFILVMLITKHQRGAPLKPLPLGLSFLLYLGVRPLPFVTFLITIL